MPPRKKRAESKLQSCDRMNSFRACENLRFPHFPHPAIKIKISSLKKAFSFNFISAAPRFFFSIFSKFSQF